MEGIGVDHRRGCCDKGHVAFPEQQIAGLMGAAFGLSRACFRFLHITVAGAGMPGGGKRDLYKAGTVYACAGVAAPKVGSA